jgi:hypothetical protein
MKFFCSSQPPYVKRIKGLSCGNQRWVACAGNREGRHALDWTLLPLELGELILSKLPLPDLARTSTTCRFFQAAFLRELAEEQSARCDLAVECLGRERMTRIVALADRFLDGQPMYPDLGNDLSTTGWWICEEGKVHLGGEHFHVWEYPLTDGKKAVVRLTIQPRESSADMLFVVRTGDGSSVFVCLDEERKGYIALNRFRGHREALAIVQALLSARLAPCLQGAFADIRLSGFLGHKDGKHNFTQAGVEALIAPLLPLVTRLSIINNEQVTVKELVQEVGQVRNSDVTLHVE